MKVDYAQVPFEEKKNVYGNDYWINFLPNGTRYVELCSLYVDTMKGDWNGILPKVEMNDPIVVFFV
jgi:hypothetical protein